MLVPVVRAASNMTSSPQHKRAGFIGRLLAMSSWANKFHDAYCICASAYCVYSDNVSMSDDEDERDYFGTYEHDGNDTDCNSGIYCMYIPIETKHPSYS